MLNLESHPCQAPKSQKDPSGPRCPERAVGDCPKWGHACRRHNQRPEWRAFRSKGGQEGGRPPTASGGSKPERTRGVSSGPLPSPDVLGPEWEALDALDERQRSGLQALLEYGEVEAAARAAKGVDASELSAWLEEDERFRRAHEALRAYRPSRILDSLQVAAAIASRQLILLATDPGQEDAKDKAAVLKVVLDQHHKHKDLALSERLDELAQQIEALQGR